MENQVGISLSCVATTLRVMESDVAVFQIEAAPTKSIGDTENATLDLELTHWDEEVGGQTKDSGRVQYGAIVVQSLHHVEESILLAPVSSLQQTQARFELHHFHVFEAECAIPIMVDLTRIDQTVVDPQSRSLIWLDECTCSVSHRIL